MVFRTWMHWPTARNSPVMFSAGRLFEILDVLGQLKKIKCPRLRRMLRTGESRRSFRSHGALRASASKSAKRSPTFKAYANCKDLTEANFWSCPELENVNGMTGSNKLTRLVFGESNFSHLPDEIACCGELTEIVLRYCNAIENVDGLSGLRVSSSSWICPAVGV